LILGKLFDECVVILLSRSLLHDDFGIIFAEVEDDVLVLLLQLESLELLKANIIDADSRSLSHKKSVSVLGVVGRWFGVRTIVSELGDRCVGGLRTKIVISGQDSNTPNLGRLH